MNIGEVLIYLNVALVILAIVYNYCYIKQRKTKHKEYLERILLSVFLTYSFCLILLFYYFLKTDLRFEYVSDYSSNDLSFWYKLSGVWAGRDGTLLIWVWATILTINAERLLDKGNERQKELTTLICSILLLSLAVIQLFINPFTENDVIPKEGNGLNPLLISPYMIVHPPIVFISYGMIVMLYAAGMANLITGEKSWNETIKRWGRSSWIGMSLALVIGGYWAYMTLGWGGYWAWDPVETAGLLPWLSMTTLLHTSIMSRRKKDYKLLGPVLAMLTFVLVLLESFVTRGGIWTSVHSFIVDETGGAWSKFWFVLENDISVRGFFIMMILSIVTTVYLIIKNYEATENRAKEYNKIEDYLTEDNTFFAAIYTQLLILTVTLVLLFVRAKGYLAPEVFEVRLAPFVIILAAIFTMHTLRPFVQTKKILIVVSFGMLFSLIYSITTNGQAWLFGAMIPWAFICGYSIFRYMWHYRTKKLLPMLKAWGPYTAHLGIMLILIGYCLSYGLGNEDSVTLDENGKTLAGNFILELDEIKMEPNKDEIELIAFIKLKDKNSGKIVIEDRLVKKIQSESDQDETVPYLKHELHRDLYLTLNTAEPGENGNESSATITVREIPGIILVWIGSFLTILGMLITMFTEWKTGKEWLRNMSKKVPDH